MNPHLGLDLDTFTRLLNKITQDFVPTSVSNALHMSDEHVLAVVRRAGRFQLKDTQAAERFSSGIIDLLLKKKGPTPPWELVGLAREAILDPDGSLGGWPDGRDIFDRPLWKLLLEKPFSREDIKGMEVAVAGPPIIDGKQAGSIASGAIFGWLHRQHPQTLGEVLAHCGDNRPLITLQSAAAAGPEAFRFALHHLGIDLTKSKTIGLIDNVAGTLSRSAVEGDADALGGLETVVAITGRMPWKSIPGRLDVLLESPMLRKLIVEAFVDNNPNGGRLLVGGGFKTLISLHEIGCDMRAWRDPENGSNMAHIAAAGATYGGAELWMAANYPELLSQPNNQGELPADVIHNGFTQDYTMQLWGAAIAMHASAGLEEETPVARPGVRVGRRL